MNVIILAAGYATRLYPLTEKTPKPLLIVAGKPIIEHIIDKVAEIKAVTKIYVVTNSKFYQHFDLWLSSYKSILPIEILSDGTRSNEDRLGAIGDVAFTLTERVITEDILLIAGDNLFEASLQEIHGRFRRNKMPIVMVFDVKDKNLARHYGVVTEKNGVITSFVEKPAQPESTLISTGIYFFPAATIPLIGKYLDQGNSADKTGTFIEWLHKREQVGIFLTEKQWYDIGTLDQLQKANKHYGR